MLLSISNAAFVISFVLLFFLNKTNRANVYLIIFFLINSIYGLGSHSIVYSKSPFLVAILFINTMPLYALSGPILYFYFRTTLNGGDARIRGWDYLHFLPAFVLLLNVFPHILTPFDYKLEMANELIKNTSKVIMIDQPIISSKLNFAIRPFHVFIYIILCAFTYFRHVKKQQESLIPVFKIRWNRNWYFVFLLFLFLTFLPYLIISFIFIFYGAAALTNQFAIMTINFTTASFFFSNLSILLFPKELYGIPFLGKLIKNLGDEQSEMENDIHFNKKASSFFLAPKRITEIAEAIKEYLVGNPCIRPGFNLTQMSLEIQIPKHQLTYFFNDHLKITFNDWKNEIRITHFIGLAKNGQAINNTLESLSQSSGFLSRSKFTNAFKKSQGKTPSAFLKKLNLD
jgi:AraC-like DNA-binding protein